MRAQAKLVSAAGFPVFALRSLSFRRLVFAFRIFELPNKAFKKSSTRRISRMMPIVYYVPIIYVIESTKYSII